MSGKKVTIQNNALDPEIGIKCNFRSVLTAVNVVLIVGAGIFFLRSFAVKQRHYYTNYSFIGGDMTSISIFICFYGVTGVLGSHKRNLKCIRIYLVTTLMSIGIRVISITSRAARGRSPEYITFAYLSGEIAIILITLPVMAMVEKIEQLGLAK